MDLARGHIAALAASTAGHINAPFRTYNLGKSELLEKKKAQAILRSHTDSDQEQGEDTLQSLEDASQRKIPAREVGRRAGDVGFCVAEVRRAETELQWKAERSLNDCSGDVWNFTKARCPEL